MSHFLESENKRKKKKKVEGDELNEEKKSWEFILFEEKKIHGSMIFLFFPLLFFLEASSWIFFFFPDFFLKFFPIFFLNFFLKFFLFFSFILASPPPPAPPLHSHKREKNRKCESVRWVKHNDSYILTKWYLWKANTFHLWIECHKWHERVLIWTGEHWFDICQADEDWYTIGLWWLVD